MGLGLSVRLGSDHLKCDRSFGLVQGQRLVLKLSFTGRIDTRKVAISMRRAPRANNVRRTSKLGANRDLDTDLAGFDGFAAAEGGGEVGGGTEYPPLGEVVGEADEAPFMDDLVETGHQEPTEAAGLLDRLRTPARANCLRRR